ncbi:MAG: beta-ketoacyl-[acyl-carrier-protein] synthase II [Gammaproteobacteria bacterium]|nr:MAG: beta-ketoacyl-[acyl-carrier-protein] synthase II [Gammaproteobacteria bacterium]|tara:strand:- start:405 stop:1649 length:1245 start_codon:yes stop_codon:yes gene_type:complete
MAQGRRVVVTGLGTVCPNGNDVISAWESVVNGQSGVELISKFDTSEFTTKFGATVKDFDKNENIDAKDSRRLDPFIQFGLAATAEAIKDSGINLKDHDLDRIGVSIGSGIGGLETIEKNSLILKDKGPKRISPFFVPGSIINMASGTVAIKYGLRGPNLSMVSACSSAGHSIGYSARSIAYGEVDIMVTGGAEAAMSPLGLAGFNAAKALSTRNESPKEASRPWDKDRDGFVLGEGSGVLILEDLESAKKRSAKIYAEIIGFGMSDDAYHMTAPAEDGKGAKLAMKNSLIDAEIDYSEIDHINAHGTSTPLGDVVESKAIRELFSKDADKILVTSTKSMTGHLLGAAGAIESIFSILSLNDSVIPPTINLANPDNEANLQLVANETISKKINYVMNNTFGFGGTNVSLIFKKFE